MRTIEINQYFGLNSKTSKSKLPLGFSQSIDNFHDIDLSTPGVAKVRGGIDTLLTLSGNPTIRRIHDWYRPSNDTHYGIIGAGTKVYTFDTAGTTAEIDSGLTNDEVLDFINYGNQLFYGNGEDDNRIYNGTSSRKWGITAPASANTFDADSGTGLTGTFSYKYAYVNSSSGHISTASAASADRTVANKTINLSGLTASADSQVDKINIYRTTNGGAIYFYLTQINNGTTTYADTTADADLGTDEAPLYNDRPNDWVYLEEWDGRIFGVRKLSTRVEFTNDEFYTQSGNPEESVHPDNYVEFNARVFGIKKSPNFDELWVHTSAGLYAIKRTEVDADPYRPVIRNSNWHSINHYSIQNLYTEQMFMYEAGKFISVDSSGAVKYESYLIEPDVSSGNKVQFDTLQSANYRKGTKNQYVCNFVRSGQTNPDRLWIANYLTRTPVIDGRDYPVWEYHKIAGTALGVVINSSGEDVLYIGTTDGKIKKCDTTITDDDGTAIDWAFSLGWMRSSQNPDKSNLALHCLMFFNPLGSWNINLKQNFDFGYSGGEIFSINFAPEGDLLDVDFVLDESVLAAENALKPVSQRLKGVYTFIELVWYGNTANQVMELHSTSILCEEIQGTRLANNR